MIDRTSVGVTHQLNAAHAKQIEKNKKRLVSIVKTVIFCGRQNIPLRGHRDDSTYERSEVNLGNFQELLKFWMDAGDDLLVDHLSTAPSNATYRSKTTQNEIIDCCRDFIIKRIVHSVKLSKIFAISCDEATDVSNQFQLPLIIRYVDTASLEVREHFISFLNLDSRPSGQAISSAILEAVKDISLDISQCRY